MSGCHFCALIVEQEAHLNYKNSLHSGKFYKVKNPSKNFLCALCSAPRSFKYSKNLKLKNLAQIALVSTALIWALYPFIGAKSVVSVFVLWLGFEIINKMLYRKGIPCPYCGFDATWYRRDVKVAHQKVRDYWETNYPELTEQKQRKGREKPPETDPPQ